VSAWTEINYTSTLRTAKDTYIKALFSPKLPDRRSQVPPVRPPDINIKQRWLFSNYGLTDAWIVTYALKNTFQRHKPTWPTVGSNRTFCVQSQRPPAQIGTPCPTTDSSYSLISSQKLWQYADSNVSDRQAPSQPLNMQPSHLYIRLISTNQWNVSWRKNFPQTFPADISLRHFLQTFPADISYKIFPQTFLADISCTRFPQTFPTDISRRHFLQTFLADISRRHFLHTFPADISYRHFPQTFPADPPTAVHFPSCTLSAITYAALSKNKVPYFIATK
jgi:hypothetical protein